MATLSGRTAVITGAGSGVGRAVALGLASKGAAVWLAGRRADALDDVAAQARTATSQVFTHQVDLTNSADVASLAARLRDAGAVDILVRAAGTISLGTVERAPVEEFDRQFQVNVRAAYAVTQALLPLLKARRGQVVFVNSSAGLAGRAGSSQYAATKHALRAVADSLREEVNEDGVRVMSVFLGRTATPMQAAVHQYEGRPFRPERLIRPEDVAEIVIDALSLAQSVEVTEITLRPMQKPES
jgi:NADP-dependent 3-hydroxy acid dehydrogenase YdfG